MTTRPVPNSITLADLAGLPDFQVLTEAPYLELRDDLIRLFNLYLGADWDDDPDRPLYKSIELFSAVLYATQGRFNSQVSQLDPRNLSGSNLDLIGALFGILRNTGESDLSYLLRVLNRQVGQNDTGTYIGLVSTMLAYPDLNIISAHAAIESSNRDVVNCYALKLDADGLKQILTDAERAAFASYTAPNPPGMPQPAVSGYLNARNRADFGRFYRVQAVTTITYTVAIKVFYDDTLHTQALLDTMIRDAVIDWAFDQNVVGGELRPRLLEARLIEVEEGLHDASVAVTTDPSVTANADGVYEAMDSRHYKGPTTAERMSGITLTFEAI